MKLFLSPGTPISGAVAALIMMGISPGAMAQQADTQQADIQQAEARQSEARQIETRRTARIVTLESVLERVETKNEVWEITEARIAQARGVRRQALAALLPNLSLQASVTRNGEEIAFGGTSVRQQYDWGVSGRASIAIFDGTMYPLLSRAGELLEASKALAKWRRRGLRFEATQSFYVLAAAQAGVAIAERTVELRQAQLERAQALLDANLGVRLDVELARAQLLEAKQNLLEARAILGNADDALGALLVVEPDVELRTDLTGARLADAQLASPPKAAPLKALDERADLRASRHQIEAIELTETAVWGSFLPRIDLSGGANYGPASAFSNPDGFGWSVTLSATWLLYDGGFRYGRLEEIEGQITEARLQYSRELRQAEVGLRRALRAWRTAVAGVEVARQQVEAATQAYQSASVRFANGLNTSIDVADASERLFQAEVALNQRVLDARTAAAEYRYLLGLMGKDEE
jgi:outer membrane protein TolC